MTLAEPLEILNNAQMAQADNLTIEAGAQGYELMSNAGAAVARSVFDHFPDFRVLVLCGPGNNGGDGYVAARLLKERGRHVTVASLKPLTELKGDAAQAAAGWSGGVETIENMDLKNKTLVIDAFFGTGFRGNLPDHVAALFGNIREKRLPVLAVDIPSGVNGDTGEVDERALPANMTVTFFRKKLGHVLMPGKAWCGSVIVSDIGIQAGALNQTGTSAEENLPVLWLGAFRPKTLFDHKYSFGHAVILGGSNMTGAALLAAQGCLRAGAGLCTVTGPEKNRFIYGAAMPSLIFETCESYDQFDAHIKDARRNAVLIGPGAGRDAPQKLWEAVYAACQPEEEGRSKSVVLDADALNVFQYQREKLVDGLHGQCVLTPHEGEFARLFPDLEGGKIDKVREAASLTGAVVLLKGPDTVIAKPCGRCAVNTNAPPWLATAGSGDVLAGMITGLLAQGMPAFEAASAAAWIHGEAAKRYGPGLISSDLPEAVPQVLRDLY